MFDKIKQTCSTIETFDMYSDILLLYTTSKTNTSSSKLNILTIVTLYEISWMVKVCVGLKKIYN